MCRLSAGPVQESLASTVAQSGALLNRTKQQMSCQADSESPKRKLTTVVSRGRSFLGLDGQPGVPNWSGIQGIGLIGDSRRGKRISAQCDGGRCGQDIGPASREQVMATVLVLAAPGACRESLTPERASILGHRHAPNYLYGEGPGGCEEVLPS